jgi:two-component system nitrogen regulation response regulator GlnG/two-component system response regulator HydG
MVTASSLDTLDSELERERRPAQEPDALVLTLAWSAHEPHRIGEIAVLPPLGASAVLGRGTDETMLPFARQRPGKLEPMPPLASPGLSRRQLVLTTTDDGVQIECVGRRVMEIDGNVARRATLREGMRVMVRGELLLVCLSRPALIPRLAHFPASMLRDFGRADALGLVGESPASWQMRDQIAFAAKSTRHVLITGPSGVGKELAARAIHALGPHADGPFVARNAATLPSALLDAELFGHVRNYPNAGMPERPGLIGAADGGTLYLDEIGELPVDAQAHLLRVLDAGGEYQRLGDAGTRTSRFRLIAATNRDVGALKHDLRARIPIDLDVPALATRRSDVPLLVRHLMDRIAQEHPDLAGRFLAAKGAPHVHPAFIERLLCAPLPLNVREIEAMLWSAIAASPADRLELPRAAKSRAKSSRLGPDEIRAALAARDGSVELAAAELGLPNRFALYRLIKKHGLARAGRR